MALKEALAARFGVGIATAIVWVRRAREKGSRAARPRGQPQGSKLDALREAILAWIAERGDITIAEIRERLVVEARHQLRRRHGLDLPRPPRPDIQKRPRTPASRTGRTSRASAKRGSTASRA
jgi:transposase